MSGPSLNVRPDWCPHQDCQFLRAGAGLICGGELPEPEEHNGGENTHRFCLDTRETGHGIFDLQVNGNDLDWMRFIFDALDGKATSWLSKRAKEWSRYGYDDGDIDNGRD